MHMVASNTPSRAAVMFIAALLAGASTAPVQAQGDQRPVTVLGHPETLTRTVQFADLSLSTAAGRRALVHRVGQAVGEVCPNAAYAHSAYNIDYDADDCVSFAWAGANPQIRRAVDLAKSGQAVAMAIEVTGAG
jgi:UrcA family protein